MRFLKNAVATAQPLPRDGIALYDPVPMRMSLERAQLLVESPSRPALQNFLAAWMSKLHALKAPRELRWHIDVDPLEF